MIAALKLAVAAGLNDASVLDGEEFKAYREMPEFQELVDKMKEKTLSR